MKFWRALITTLVLVATGVSIPSSASAAVIYSSQWGTAGGFGLNSTYWAAHKFIAGSNATITSIDIYLASGNISRLVLRANNANAPGVALETMTASTIASTTQTFTGSFTITAGTTYWLSAEVTSGAASIGVKSVLADVSAFGWTSGGVLLSSLDYGATWGNMYVGSANVFIVSFNGSAAQSLQTPNTPVINLNKSSSASFSETSTTPNASSYLISLFQSNGVTLVETKTTNSITSPTTFSGLSAGTTYKVSITAIGDGSSYANSPASPQLSFITPGTTSVSITGLSNLIYRKTSMITATVVGGNGFVTFFLNGKRVPKCIKLATNALSATCNFQPSTRGIAQLSINFLPLSASLETSGNTYSIAVANRMASR